MEHLIELKNVFKIYQMGSETVHALDGVDLTIDQGEFVAIVGSSGSGKSTAMNIIGCLDVPTSGTYHLAGVDVSTMAARPPAKIPIPKVGIEGFFSTISATTTTGGIRDRIFIRKLAARVFMISV